MDIYKKLLEYKAMFEDGVISGEEFQKLKQMLYTSKMREMGIQDEAEFEEIIKKDVFKEAVLMLEKNTVSSYREAISLLEKLGNWGNAPSLIEQCKEDLVELEKQEELIRAEEARIKLYTDAIQKLRTKSVANYEEAIKDLESLGEYKDAEEILEKAKLELPELKKKKAEEKEIAEADRRKKRKIAIIACASIAVIIIAFIVISDAIKPNLMKHGDMKAARIHNISYQVPEDWKEKKVSSWKDTQYYTLDNKGKTVAALVVMYKGENDLSGKAGYNEDGDDHYSFEDAIVDVQDADSGVYKQFTADTSVFEVGCYCNENKVKNRDKFLASVQESFDTANYKNLRKISDVLIKYEGDTEAGVKVAKMNLTVTAVYDTGVAKGEKTLTDWELKNPVTFEAGKTSTITVIVDGKEYSKKVKCTTEVKKDEDEKSSSGSTSIRSPGSATISGVDDFMEEYEKSGENSWKFD